MQVTERKRDGENLLNLMDRYRSEMFSGDTVEDVKTQMDERQKELGEKVVARFGIRQVPKRAAAKRRKGKK